LWGRGISEQVQTSPELPRVSKRSRLLLIATTGVLLLSCLACAGAGALWFATPNYLSATLSGVSRFELGNEQCINPTGRVVNGTSFYITRQFVSAEPMGNVTMYYLRNGWDALTLYVEKAGLIRRDDPKRQDVFIGTAIIYSGISVFRNQDASSRIEMRSTMVFCPL
jgi:hypothetical protein